MFMPVLIGYVTDDYYSRVERLLASFFFFVYFIVSKLLGDKE
jgi:hypothetical protein